MTKNHIRERVNKRETLFDKWVSCKSDELNAKKIVKKKKWFLVVVASKLSSYIPIPSYNNFSVFEFEMLLQFKRNLSESEEIL